MAKRQDVLEDVDEYYEWWAMKMSHRRRKNRTHQNWLPGHSEKNRISRDGDGDDDADNDGLHLQLFFWETNLTLSTASKICYTL